jgi:Helix-turn-helix domain
MDDLPQQGGRWGTVAASVMRRPGLSVAAKAVYAALATYSDRHGWIWCRQSQIAGDLERSRTWVLAAIAELEAAGLLLHERRYVEGRQRASRYRLLDGVKRFAAADGWADIDAPADGLADQEQESDVNDSAVPPADSNHHEEDSDSLSAAGAREPNRIHEFPRKEDVPQPVPADWVPTAADVGWAKARHPRLDVMGFTELFVLSCQAKGYCYADPSAGWRRWLIEPKGRLPLLPSPPLPRTDTTTQDQIHDRPSFPHARHCHHSAPRSAADGPSLAESNAAHAAAVLERFLARRAGGAAAGPAG